MSLSVVEKVSLLLYRAVKQMEYQGAGQAIWLGGQDLPPPHGDDMTINTSPKQSHLCGAVLDFPLIQRKRVPAI